MFGKETLVSARSELNFRERAMFRDPIGMKVVSFEHGEPHLEQKNYTKRKEQHVICSLRYPWFSARFLPGFTFDVLGGKCVQFDLDTKETPPKLFSAESFG